MRREPWFAVGLLLAAIAEVQWASTFYASDDVLHAAVLFVAGCGLFLAAGGVFFKQEAWTWLLGLAVAGLAHAVYLAITFTWGSLVVLAAFAAAAGLTLAAWGTRGAGNVNVVRAGLFLAALGGALWTIADTLSGDMSFMVGNVFAMVGWGAAAAMVPEKVA